MNQDYSDFLKKVDGFVQEKTELFHDQMVCKVGCFDCCAPKLTVTQVEADAIVEFCKNQQMALPPKPLHQNRCMNLDSEGRCLIYPVRPLVCRTHGLPIDYKVEKDPKEKKKVEEKSRSVCPKNFVNQKIGELNPTDVLNGDTMNLIIGMINMKIYGKIERVSLERLGR